MTKKTVGAALFLSGAAFVAWRLNAGYQAGIPLDAQAKRIMNDHGAAVVALLGGGAALYLAGGGLK